MSKIIVPIEMPNVCAECPFREPTEYFPAGDGLYKKFSCCQFAPDSLEDPWRSVRWQMDNKEDWCPLEPAEGSVGIEEYEHIWYEED